MAAKLWPCAARRCSHEAAQVPQIAVHQADDAGQGSPCEECHDEALVGPLVQHPLCSSPLQCEPQGVGMKSSRQVHCADKCVNGSNQEISQQWR